MPLQSNRIAYLRRKGPYRGPFLRIRIKALIYRYTGIYLAKKELEQYLNSRVGLRDINKYAKSLSDQYLARDIAIGMWEVENGFARPLSFLRFSESKFKRKILAPLAETYSAVKSDIRKLLWKYGIRV